MTDFSDIQDTAGEAAGWFEVACRTESDESSYYRLRDGAPEWVKDIVYAAHHGWVDFFPDDWRYETTANALAYIHNTEELDSVEFADGEVDIYNSDRIAWLASNGYRADYCDEAANEYGVERDATIIDRIGLGQFYEASEVFDLVMQALEALAASAGVES